MFSEAVDEVVRQSGRPARRAEIATFVNATIRECNSLAYFLRQMIEDQLTTSAAPFIWTRSTKFHTFRTVEYPAQTGFLVNSIWPKLLLPGKHLEDEIHYYYFSGDSVVFAGLEVSGLINVAYFEYFKRLKDYVDPTTRPAVWDFETETFTYLSAFDNNETERANARDLTSNWILQYWNHLIVEGAKAKIYLTTKDIDRSRPSFALYKSYQDDLLKMEPVHGSVGEQRGV